jgi:hypothetical protein
MSTCFVTDVHDILQVNPIIITGKLQAHMWRIFSQMTLCILDKISVNYAECCLQATVKHTEKGIRVFSTVT